MLKKRMKGHNARCQARESAAGKNKTAPLALNPISDEHESGPHMGYAHDNSQVRCDAAVSIEGKNLNFKQQMMISLDDQRIAGPCLNQ